MSASSGPLTRDEAERLLQRTTDPAWIEGHRADPNGKSVLNAWGEIGEYASRAVTKQTEAGQVSLAPGGRPGVCTLIATRTNTTLPDTTIPKGYKFKTDLGFNLLLVEAVVVKTGVADVVLNLETERKTDLVNTVDPAFDPLMQPGDFLGLGVHVDNDDITYTGNPADLLIGSYLKDRPPGPVPSDVTLVYKSSTGITLAEGDWISALGNERGQRRQANEATEDYRLRVRNVPDAVSPKAIEEAVKAAASQAKLPTVWMLEPLYDGADPLLRAAMNLAVMDGPFCDGERLTAPNIGEPTEYLDDPFGYNLTIKLPFRNYEMPSIREGRAYFMLALLGYLMEPDDLVFYSSLGTESVSIDYCDDEVFGYLDVGLQPEELTGIFGTSIHPVLQQSLLAITEEAARKKAGGVHFDLYIENATIKHENNQVTVLGWSPVFQVIAGVGEAWFLREALISALVNDPLVIWDPLTFAFRLFFVFSDGSTFTTPDFTDRTCDHLTRTELEKIAFPFGKPITEIWGFVKGDGAVPVNLDGTFWLDTMQL